MNFYIYLNLAVLVPPLLLSFDRKVGFYKNWIRLGLTVLAVSSVYIVWDVLVTERGHWWFSERYAGTGVVFGLPIGEILFFITVPYACLFIYEVVRAYFKAGSTFSRRVSSIILISGIAIFAALGIVFLNKGYTSLAFFSVSLFLLLVLVFDRGMFTERHVLLYFGLSYIAFLIVNSVLTGLPVVLYGETATTGIRVFTIPFEDFFYNFGLLGFYLIVYRALSRRKPANG